MTNIPYVEAGPPATKSGPDLSVQGLGIRSNGMRPWAQSMGFGILGLGFIVPLKQIEHGVSGDLIVIYPKPYCIYLRGTIGFRASALRLPGLGLASAGI